MILLRTSRKESKVIIGLSTGLPHEDQRATTMIEFECEANQVFLAELLRQHIDQKIRYSVAQARREAYEAGWKDAKAHKEKQNSFSSLLDNV
jgi:hypothetical protein